MQQQQQALVLSVFRQLLRTSRLLPLPPLRRKVRFNVSEAFRIRSHTGNTAMYATPLRVSTTFNVVLLLIRVQPHQSINQSINNHSFSLVYAAGLPISCRIEQYIGDAQVAHRVLQGLVRLADTDTQAFQLALCALHRLPDTTSGTATPLPLL
jgi:hypothetical protein